MSISADSIMKDNDCVAITFEDQKNINKFANLNAKLEDINDELKVKQNDLANIEEAYTELELMDENDDKIPYLTGDIFICQTVGEVMKLLENDKMKKTNEIKNLELQLESIKNQMSDLKVYLYGKFANKINLENDDD